MSRPRFVAVLLLSTVMACSNPTTKTGSVDAAGQANPKKENTAAKPLEMVGHIPVYRQWSDLEPLFQQKTDTTYVINFWATWCKPCVEELPYFEQLYDNMEQEKLRIILVSMDFPQKFETKLLPFVKEHQLRSDVVAFADPDQNNWIPKINEEWVGAIPVTIVYNAEERKFFGEQFADYQELEDLVRSML